MLAREKAQVFISRVRKRTELFGLRIPEEILWISGGVLPGRLVAKMFQHNVKVIVAKFQNENGERTLKSYQHPSSPR